MKVGEMFLARQYNGSLRPYSHVEVAAIGGAFDMDDLSSGEEYVLLEVKRVVKVGRVLVDVSPEPADVPLEVPFPEVVG